MYLTNRLELDAHIFTQGKYGTLDVSFGGLVDFGLRGSIFGTKNYVFGTFTTFLEPPGVPTHLLEPPGVRTHILTQCRSWTEMVP